MNDPANQSTKDLIVDIGVPAAVRQLDPDGGWDHETTGGWPDMPTYRALRRAVAMGYVEQGVAFDVLYWRLTDEGIQFRKEIS